MLLTVIKGNLAKFFKCVTFNVTLYCLLVPPIISTLMPFQGSPSSPPVRLRPMSTTALFKSTCFKILDTGAPVKARKAKCKCQLNVIVILNGALGKIPSANSDTDACKSLCHSWKHFPV